jgi:hypothetical protein
VNESGRKAKIDKLTAMVKTLLDNGYRTDEINELTFHSVCVKDNGKIEIRQETDVPF